MGWSLVSKKPQTCLRRALPIGHNADHYSERARSLLHFDEKANDESARSFICTFQKEEPKSNTGALETSLFRRVCVVFVGSSLCSPYFARGRGNGVMREREKKLILLANCARKIPRTLGESFPIYLVHQENPSQSVSLMKKSLKMK